MGTTITPLDPADEADLTAYHQVLSAAHAVDVPDFPELPLRQVTLALRHPMPASDVSQFLARIDGQPAGALTLDLPTEDNLHLANVELVVHPRWRRRSVGGALFATAIEVARSRGRTVLLGFCVTELPGGPARDPGHAAFAAAVGARPALPEVRRRLNLDTVDRSGWSDLHAEASARAASGGYTVVGWAGDTPDELAAEVARLEARMVIDAPSGELKIEAEKYDAARIRAIEQVFRQRERGHYHAAAHHEATGMLAGITMIAFDTDVHAHAWQHSTIVDPDHRGRRLGMLLKLENLRQTLACEPRVRHIDTWNAAENAHMIAINEAIGFRPVDHWINWQMEI